MSSSGTLKHTDPTNSNDYTRDVNEMIKNQGEKLRGAFPKWENNHENNNKNRLKKILNIFFSKLNFSTKFIIPC